MSKFKSNNDFQIDKSIISCFSNLLSKDVRLFNKLTCYLNASFETVNKYSSEQLVSAIDKLSKEESYNGFTNNNSARLNMKSNVVSRDAIILILIYFNNINIRIKL